jgi:hypothetical protein
MAVCLATLMLLLPLSVRADCMSIQLLPRRSIDGDGETLPPPLATRLFWRGRACANTGGDDDFCRIGRRSHAIAVKFRKDA